MRRALAVPLIAAVAAAPAKAADAPRAPLLRAIHHARNRTWHWQDRLGVRRLTYAWTAERSPSRAYRRWVLRLWRRRAHVWHHRWQVRPRGVPMRVLVTAYCLRGTTATGVPAGPGVVAVDPSVIRLGTRLYIPGWGPGRALDTGGAIIGRHVDAWMASCSAALEWGARVKVIEVGP